MLIASKQYDFCVNNLLLAAALIFSNVFRYGLAYHFIATSSANTQAGGETLLGKRFLFF
jgi:hypothetical protein